MSHKTSAPHRAKKTATSFFRRHRYISYVLLVIAALLALLVLTHLINDVSMSLRQNRLKPFYDTSDLRVQGQLGEVVRQEPLGAKVAGGKGVRILYRTQRADGSYTFSSGMVFIPDNAKAGLPRPVVAWAHGTLGLGDKCAPSRIANPMDNISWVSTMLQKGWVVTATDYAGFGTPGIQGYLVGGDEAHDVLNSVRAARNVPETHAGTDFVIMGHSQGGNSALFTADQAAAYAPELHPIATVAEAPAAELVPLLNEQYDTLAAWVIGPLVTVSWPAANSSLHASDITTGLGKDNYRRIADQCIAQSVVGGLVRTALKQKFFSKNPLDLAAWKAMAEQQSAPIPPTNRPLMIVESKSDKVVLPNTTALYIQQACNAGSNLSSLWLDNVSHQDIPTASSDTIISWISDRFAGKPNTPSCSQPLPVKPA
jgi:alpha-beta hydrolase superfamily lysophospholipase